MEAQSITKSGSRSATLHVPLARPMPKLVQWTFLLFVASIPLEALPISEDLTLTRLVGLVFFASYLLRSGLPLRLDLPAIPAALWWFLAYLMVYAFAGLGSIKDEGIRNYVMSHFQLVQLFTLFWFGSGMLRDPSFAKKSMLTMAIACVCLAVASLIGVPGFSPEVDEGRATALDFSPNTLASLMAYAAILIIGFCLQETGWSAKRKLFLFALTTPLFLVLVSTGSRAGIGAFVIGMSFFFIPHRGSKRQKLAFVVALAAIAAIVFLVVMDPRVSERWSQTIVEGESAGREHIYGAALDMISERPITGWGGKAAFEELGARLGLLGRSRAAHNLILHLLIEVGLLGTIPFMVALYLCARAAWKGRADRFGLIPFALIMAIFAFNLSHAGIVQKLLWLFLGFAVAASSINQERRFRWIASRRPAGPSGEGLQPRVSVPSNSWPASLRESRSPTSFQSPNKKA